MMISKSNLAKKHPLPTFFILAYAFSWLVEIPLVLSANSVIAVNLPLTLHYLASYGPMLAAVIVTGLTEGRAGLRHLGDRITKWKLNPVWWLVAISPLGIYLLAVIGQWMILGLPINLSMLGQVDYLPNLGLAAFPLWVLTFGIGEETGWRGYALPQLQKDRSPFSATLILWVFWALWHLPLFFYAYTAAIIPGMLIGLLAGAMIFTWLYNSTGGSVLMVALWHGAFNTVTACLACKSGLIAPIVSTAVMVWAVNIAIDYQKKFARQSQIKVPHSKSREILTKNDFRRKDPAQLK